MTLISLLLIGCSTNEQSPMPSSNDIEVLISNIFAEDNFTELTVLRNKVKKNKTLDLDKFDLMVGKEVSQTFLACDALGRTYDFHESFSKSGDEKLPSDSSIKRHNLFEESFMIFHPEIADNLESFLSDHYLSCYKNHNYDRKELLKIPLRIKDFNFKFNSDVFKKADEKKEEVYQQLIKIVDSRDYDKFFVKTEVELELLQDYKDAAKYEKFVEGMTNILDPNGSLKSLTYYASSLEQAFGIPGFKTKADLEKIHPGFAKYHQFEGIWMGQSEFLRQSSSYTFLKFDDYKVFNAKSNGSSQIPEFTSYNDLYYFDNKLSKSEKNQDDYFNYILSGDSLQYFGITYRRVR